MLRFRIGLLVTIAALGLIAFNTIQATNESYFPLIFNKSMIPTKTPTMTFTPSPTPLPTATLTPTVTPTATQTATQAPQADVGIVEETASLEAALDGEYIELENQGVDGINIIYWTLADEDGNVFTFPSFFLDSGATVKIWTKSGTNTSTDLFWGLTQEVWNNDGDTATLNDHAGNEIDVLEY
jgi:hypothetical protein